MLSCRGYNEPFVERVEFTFDTNKETHTDTGLYTDRDYRRKIMQAARL